MKTALEKAVADIDNIFTKYAKDVAPHDSLNESELKKLFTKELSLFDEKTFGELATILIKGDDNNEIDRAEFIAILYCLCGQFKPKH